MDIWIINSSNGILSAWGYFETEEECWEQCKFLMEVVHKKVSCFPIKIQKFSK